MKRHVQLAIRFGSLVALALALGALPAAAQSPTGSISGRVVDTQGAAIPGANVSILSTSLQGTERAVTEKSGDYLFTLLPPGAYVVTVDLQGFAPTKKSVVVGPMQNIRVDAELSPKPVDETVTVLGGAATYVDAVEAATSVQQTLMNTLPVARTLRGAVNMTPAGHNTGPNGYPSISGAMSFENLYMINGVEAQDNLRGTPFNLYIEDALDQTVVGSSGISAEYGRFDGGIVNAITKSGGNTVHASFRSDVTNDDWRTVSPYGEPKKNHTVPVYQATLGGYLVKDRLWFFAAGRSVKQVTAEQTNYTNIPYDATNDEQRYEGKLIASLGTGRRLEADYIGIRDQQINTGSDSFLDLANLRTRNLPENLFALHYTGAVGAHLFVEGQYSMRTLAFQHDGGTTTDLVAGTALRDQETGAFYGAPEFCGVCGDETRNNDEAVLKGSYFLPTSAGSHQMVFGYDTYNDRLKGDNHQSGSDFQIFTTSYQLANGAVYPVIAGDDSTWIVNFPIQDASQGTNFRTHSLFYNDAWSVNPNVSVTFGARWDRNHGKDASGNLVSDSSLVSPRVGINYNIDGEGRTAVSASYGRYAAALNNTIANEASPAGVPAILAYFYEGPDINVDPSKPLVATSTAVQQVFNWFNGSDGQTLFFANIPGLASKVNGSLKSPYSDEFAGGVSQRLGSRGELRVDVVHRNYGNFYSGRIDTTTGQASDEFGQPYDVKLIENTNLLKRTYNALLSQLNYRVSPRFLVGASYTLSKLYGNADGENVGTGPLDSDIQAYPEYSDPSWSHPMGDLSADQRHRLRAWSTINLMDRGANVTLGLFQQAESGTPYGAVGGIHSTDYVDNPGYALPADPVTYYFTAPDAYRTAWMYSTDVALNVSRRIGTRQSTEVYARFDVLNVFNNFQLFNNASNQIDTTVLTAADTPTLKPFNPFTDTPVEGVNWEKGPNFGKPNTASAYTLPRTFRFSFGMRF